MTKYLIEKGTNYSYLIDALKKPSFESLRKLSVNFVNQLPEEVRTELWEALFNGVEVLESEALLSMYMYAYGKMHAAKLQAAFEHLPTDKLEDIHLIDWGCGQAMATVVYYEYLKEKEISSTVKTITLIEPSELALKRAALHARKLFPNAEIKTVKKEFDKLTAEDIQIDDNQTVLHLFSNVLDMEYFNIEQLAGLIEQNKAYNLLVCVSPYINDFKNQRLINFISCFQNSNIIADYVNQEWHCGWTIDFKVVEVNLAVITDYYNLETEHTETVTDIDGNVYKTVKIGNQIWMAENLRVSRYRNGDKIPNVTDNNEWSKLDSGAYCNYDNNRLLSKLYNWKAVDDKRGLAPEGWHIPSEQEWFILTQNLEFQDLIYISQIPNKSIFGKKFKDYNNGFSELVSECRDIFGAFYNISYEGAWWNTSGKEASDAWLQMSRFKTSLPDFDDLTDIWESYQRANAFCVRCVKDSETIEDLNTEVNEIDDSIEIVQNGQLYGLWNSKGEIITPFIFDNVIKLNDGSACVFINKKYGYINKRGEIIVPIIYEVTEYFMGSHDYNFYCGLTEVKQNDKYGFVDKKGNVKIPIIYDSVGYFNENLVSVCLNHKYGYLNNFGEIVVPLIYDFATSFKDGFGEVSLRGKYGFVNKMGELIIPCKFESVKCFSEGYAAVRLNNKFGFIDTEGSLMIPCIFKNPYNGLFYEYDNTKYELYVFKNGECLVEFNNKFVAINKSGEVLREVDVTWYVE